MHFLIFCHNVIMADVHIKLVSNKIKRCMLKDNTCEEKPQALYCKFLLGMGEKFDSLMYKKRKIK